MKKYLIGLVLVFMMASKCYGVENNIFIESKKAKEIRNKYKIERQILDKNYRDDKLSKKQYRILRRKIVLLRQKTLLEINELENEISPIDGTTELERINEELAKGIKDVSLVCPDDTFPHNPYPSKNRSSR